MCLGRGDDKTERIGGVRTKRRKVILLDTNRDFQNSFRPTGEVNFGDIAPKNGGGTWGAIRDTSNILGG